jgi:hypothetical protein
MANEFKDVITRLERQRTAIDRALAALREVDDSNAAQIVIARRRRPKKATRRKANKAVSRTISDEGRKRIAEAQRKRWALKKRAAKKTGPKKTGQAA